MSTLPASHPVVRAMKKAKISNALMREFSAYLKEFPHWEQQALYLLEDKGDIIENIIFDLFAVHPDEQPTWSKKQEEKEKEEEENVLPPPPDIDEVIPSSEFTPPSLFKDWKQEHGFESIPIEVGDIHTFVRFKQIVTHDQEERFEWSFNRARYGKRGWGNEKPIKSISNSLLDNNNNPGWVVRTFLEENKALTDLELTPREGKEIPNPLILSSRDSHAMIYLLLGHPFLFYGESHTSIRHSHTKVEFRVNVHTHENHKVLAGIFFSINKDGERLPIITEDFVDSGFMLYGKPVAIVFDNKYYEVLPTAIPSRMIRDSFHGVLIPNEEFEEFQKKWNEWYPEVELNFLDPLTTETPDFSARKIKDWRYWLFQPEYQVQLFEKEEDISWIKLHEDTSSFNSNRMAVNFDNYLTGEPKLAFPSQCPRAVKLFQIIDTIINGGKRAEEDYFSVERQAASQLLILSEEYPYALSYNDQSLITSSELDFRITVKKNPDNPSQYFLQGEVCHVKNNKWKPLFKNSKLARKVVGIVPSYLLHEDQLMRIGSMKSGRLINDTIAGVIVESEEISDFYATALPYIRQRGIKINDPQGLLRVSALYNYRLQGVMTIWEIKGLLMGRLDAIMHTDIGDYPYPIDLAVDEFEQVMDGKKFKIPKNLDQEKDLKQELYDAGWVDEGDGEYSMREEVTKKFVLEVLNNQDGERRVTYVGQRKLKRWKTKQVLPSISTSIKTSMDWLDVNVEVKLDGKLLNLKDLIKLWKQGEEAMELPKNSGLAVIDKEWLSKYAPIINKLVESSDTTLPKSEDSDEEDGPDVGKQMKVEKYQLGLLSELEQASEEVDVDDEWSELAEKFTNFKGVKKRKIPSTVNATLRDYQKEGVNWLCFLREYGFGGILADDMGLGKTLQTLTFLAIEMKKKLKKPSIVIAPTSVVTNWVAEAERFVPTMKVVILHGNKRKELFYDAKKADLIVTTYGLLQRDLEVLKAIDYNAIILDEAQTIKNAKSKTALSVQQLKGNQRLSLTGTPIENSALELWSQFNFLMPGFFGSIKEFEKLYVRPAKKNKKKKHDLGLLRRQTRPFILRRLKKNVAKELPPKTEQVLYCEMGDDQRRLYDSVMEICRQQIREKISVGGMKGVQITVFDALLKLRQICCEPRLSSLVPDTPPQSAKMNLFSETLTGIVEEGHRVLVFSQFVKMLNLISAELTEKGVPHLQLDGSTKDRETLIRKFQQSGEYPVFLISLKAGGTGINLTAADYVIHYDPWWNPAAEAQATDRAYRIGQKNHLMVYKLITRNSIEEKILDLQKKKKALADKVVGESSSLESMLDIEDLQDIFAI